MKISELFESVAGPETYSMQHRIFNCAIALSLLLYAGFLPYSLFAKQWAPAAGIVFSILAYGYIYVLTRYKDRLQLALFLYTIIAGLVLNIGWLINDGPAGSVPFYVFVLLLVVIFTANNPIRYIVAVLINIILMMFVEHDLKELIVYQGEQSYVAHMAAFINAVIYISLLAWLYKRLISKKTSNTFSEIVLELETQTGVVNSTADQLAKSSDQLLAESLKQKSAIEELSSSAEELGVTAGQNRQVAITAMTSINETKTKINQSQENVDHLIEYINKTKDSSKQIQKINTVVKNISSQTKLLSLNAMIEASRAAEAGSGFKVVALEVGKLAEDSANSVADINTLLVEDLKLVEDGVNQSTKISDSFRELVERTQPLVESISNVSHASEEQGRAINQIAQGLLDIDKAVEQNLSLAEETKVTAEELRSKAALLTDVIDRIKQEIDED